MSLASRGWKLLRRWYRRSRTHRPHTCGKGAGVRFGRGLEPLEPRLLLSADMPVIPGMRPVETEPEDLQGQVIHLDFDGAEDVTYDGPRTVEGIDVPAFSPEGASAGERDRIISAVLGQNAPPATRIPEPASVRARTLAA